MVVLYILVNIRVLNKTIQTQDRTKKVGYLDI